MLPKSSHPSTNTAAVRNLTNNSSTPKPKQESGAGYEAKLVEMINTSIVDRSPSVKWEDVGEKLIICIVLSLFQLCLFCDVKLKRVAYMSLFIRSWSRESKASFNGDGYFTN